MSVHIDILEGYTVQQSANDLRAIRTAVLTGLDGAASALAYKALIHPDMPVMYAPHPTIPNLRLVRRSAEAIDADKARVTLEYALFLMLYELPHEGDTPKIQVGSTVQEVATNMDVNGDQMFVSHTYPDGRTVEQGGEVQIQVPQTVFRLSRKENSSPEARARAFVGTVNSGPWKGDAARFWLCTRIEGNSDDGGETYDVAYEFQRNPNTWDALVVFIDPETNKPPNGLVDGTGLKTYQVYPATDFNFLELT
jgi:hypothetical protein